MSCTITALAACFSLSGFYVDGALVHSNRGEQELIESTHYVVDKSTKGWEIITPVRSIALVEHIDNPYVRISLGYDVQWSARWATRIDYSHESSIATTDDRGEERLSLGVTWRPFAR